MHRREISNSDIELIRTSEYFDANWYAAEYKDVSIVGMDPVEHFLWLGGRLKRNPSPKFCTTSYLTAYADVERDGLNPLVHYLRIGQSENRRIHAVMPRATRDGRTKAKRLITRHHTAWDDQLSESAVQMLERAEYAFRDELVSIVMPTRNRARTIAPAIQSALAQTHAKFELIIVDDGSTDDTRSVIESCQDDRIRYVSNDGTHGVSRARNIALEKACGRWIFFLDSDNTWHPRMVELMLRHAEVKSVSAGYCAAALINDESRRWAVLYADYDFETLAHENFIDMNCFFMRWEGEYRNFRFDEELLRLVDWDFILHVGSRTRIVGVPFIGVQYYDGRKERISNREYGVKAVLQALMAKIRKRAHVNSVRLPVIPDAASYRVAVVWHVFHTDRVNECLEYLRAIDFEYDLFVTTSLKEDEPALAKIRAACPWATILFYPNTGADLGPFLELVSTLKNYFAICKIHTKRDVGQWGNAWRKELMDSVLASREYVTEVIGLFKANPNLKLVASKELYKHGAINSIPATMEHVKDLAGQIGMGQQIGKDWAFVAGTMFWMRPQPLLELARHMCDSEGYSKIFRQDGAVEHGLERLVGLCLWGDADAQVALRGPGGALKTFPLGQGHTLEGVSQTMTRLTK